MRSDRNSFLGLAVAAAVLLATWPAQLRAAEDHLQVLYDDARSLYKQGRFEAAMEKLRVLYEKRPEPRLLFNFGQLHDKLDQKTEAMKFYKSFLKDDPEAPKGMRREALAAIERLRPEVEPRRKEDGDATPGPPKPSPGGVDPPPPSLVPLPLPAPPPPIPIYKRWWPWTIAGGVVVGGVAVGLGVGLTRDATLTMLDIGPTAIIWH